MLFYRLRSSATQQFVTVSSRIAGKHPVWNQARISFYRVRSEHVSNAIRSTHLHETSDMDLDLQPKADELIRALGELGLAQERLPNSPDIATLTRRAQQLHESLLVSNSDS